MTLTAYRSAPETRALDYHQLVQPVEALLQDLRSYLAEQLSDFEPEARELAAYCLKHEGKRLRPLMVFFGRCHDDLHGNQATDLVRAAAVVEMVHQATLVHDDILDDASMRHSSATPWARWGRSAAVLIGDALFAQALQLASQFETVAVCRAVSAATRQVCSGEIAQTFRRGHHNQDYAHYLRVIDLKTAELFRVSGYLGAHLTGASESHAHAVGTFCRHLGIAYQMFDDLADYAASEARAGKTLGTDMASGKLTLPIFCHLETLSDAAAHQWQQSWMRGEITPAQLRTQLAASGAFDQSLVRVYAEIAAADEALQPALAVHPSLRRMTALSRFVEAQVERFRPTDALRAVG